MTQKHLFTILSLFVALLYGQVSYSCNCRGKESVEKSFKTSEIIFVGTLIPERRYTDSLLEFGYNINDSIQSFKFRIEKLYKGTLTTDTVTIISDNSTCGSLFWVNKRYIIYGTITEASSKYKNGVNIYWTDNCKRTCLWNKKEIRGLSKLTK